MKLELLDLVKYHEHQIASRSLSKKLDLKEQLMIYAFDQGESISQESSTQTKLLEVLEGKLEVNFADGTKETLQALELLTIPATKKHGLLALEPCKFIQLGL